MSSSSPIRWVIACAAGLLLAACDGDPPAEAQAPKVAREPKAPQNPLPAEMVAAVSSSRNARVIGVHFQLKGNPTVGKALPVDIAIIPHEAVSSLDVHFQAREGLAVAAGGVLERVADPTPGKAITHQLVLLADREGVFMVTAIVETEGSDGMVSRIFSIPVIVAAATTGEAPPAPASAPPAPPPATPTSG